MRRYLLVAVLAHATRATAQSVPQTILKSPAAELTDPFTQIGSVRELSDGRVYVSDARDKVVGIADFAAKTFTKVGRVGAGPGEFTLPSRLFVAGGDTTWLYDGAAGRLLMLLPDGKTGPTRPIETTLVGANAFRAIDERGRFYIDGRPYGMNADPTFHVIRFDPATKRVDTVAHVAQPTGRVDGARSLGGGMLLRLNNKPYAKEDAAAVGADGRVAVVRAADYHVEWFEPTGKLVRGAPVAYTPIPISSDEKRAFLLRRVVPGQITVSGPPPGTPGAGRTAIATGPMSTEALDDTGMEWPLTMPAFVGGAASIARDGTLWVLRTHVHADSAASYDVFDAAGRLSRRVVLPLGSRLAGFGRDAVFIARKDADDLEYLQRFTVR